MTRQASRRQFHSTILHANRSQLFDAHGNRRYHFESKFKKKLKFKKFPWVTPLFKLFILSLRERLLHFAPTHSTGPSTPVLVPDLCAPRSYVTTPLMSQQELTPDAATDSQDFKRCVPSTEKRYRTIAHDSSETRQTISAGMIVKLSHIACSQGKVTVIHINLK